MLQRRMGLESRGAGDGGGGGVTARLTSPIEGLSRENYHMQGHPERGMKKGVGEGYVSLT